LHVGAGFERQKDKEQKDKDLVLWVVRDVYY
jgi:hypothetical protein